VRRRRAMIVARVSRSKKLWLVGLWAVNLLAAIAVLLILWGRGYAFHLAGMYFTPGTAVLVGMLVVDVLIFLLISRESK